MAEGKKVLKGCLWGCGGLVLIVIILGVGTAVFVGVSAQRFGKGIEQSYREVGDGYSTIDEEIAFTPPDDELLNEERVDRLLTIRAAMAEYAKERLQSLEDAGKEIENHFESPGFREKMRGVGAIKDIVRLGANMASDTGKEHLRLLRDSEMSMREYRWLIRIYLATIAKAEENGQESLTEIWKTYQERFKIARERARNVDINLGKKKIRGRDMTVERLLKSLEGVKYNAENAALVERTMDRLLPDDIVPAFDYLALHLEDILGAPTTAAPDLAAIPAPDPAAAPATAPAPAPPIAPAPAPVPAD